MMTTINNKQQDRGLEIDDLEDKVHLARTCLNELLARLQTASVHPNWPAPFPVPFPLVSPFLSSLSTTSLGNSWLHELPAIDNTEENSHLSSSDGALDLSTRSEPVEDSSIQENFHPFLGIKSECNAAQLPISPLGFCKDMDSVNYLHQIFDWMPSYQVFLATREYMDLMSIQTLTNKTPTFLERHQPAPVLQELVSAAEQSSAGKHFVADLFRGPNYAELVAKEFDYTNNARIPVSGLSTAAQPNTPFPVQPPVSTQSVNSNLLLLNPLNSPANSYSPPLNFSAFASLDQNMVCPICRKCFRFEKNLLRHLQKTHATGTGESVLKCKLCNYTTRHYSNMYVHIRTHTGDKPYSCSACGVSFTQGSSLKLHIRSRHEDNAKYFSLTRKPGKNNLTKLWTRVLKKDLPKYNSAMSSTFFSRPKYWTQLNPLKCTRTADCHSIVPYPKDPDRFAEDCFTWSSCVVKSSLYNSIAQERLNHTEPSPSMFCNLKQMKRNAIEESFELELSRIATNATHNRPDRALQPNIDQSVSNRPSTSRLCSAPEESLRKKQDKRDKHFHSHLRPVMNMVSGEFELGQSWSNEKIPSQDQFINEPRSDKQAPLRLDKSPASPCLVPHDRKQEDPDSRWNQANEDLKDESRDSHECATNGTNLSKQSSSNLWSSFNAVSTSFTKVEPGFSEIPFMASCSNTPADYSTERGQY